MNRAPVTFDELPEDVMILVNGICNRFEQRWRSGEHPAAESMLDEVDSLYREALLRELLPLEVEYRRGCGMEVNFDQYRRRFLSLEETWLATLTLVSSAGTEAVPRVKALGKYEIMEEVGRGGMGVVYRAREVELGRVVALKTMRGGEFVDPDHLQRFQLEAKAVAALDHPNIVPIYEVGDFECRPYLAMKLLEGGSVAELLKEGKWATGSRTDFRRAAQLVATVAEAIHHAHQHGILHRDLKPANILLDASQQPYVSDFGLAKRLHDQDSLATQSLTDTDAIVGTPSYMAPEQAAGKGQLTTATDVYALGSILYELLTGRRPFAGNSSLEIIQQVCNDAPAPPSRLVSGLPRDLETICLKCLEKEPQRRYASAGELAAELRRYLEGRPIAARPVPAWARAARLARRHPAVTGMLATVVVVVLVSFALVTWKWREARLANQGMQAALLQAETAHYVSLIDQANRGLADRKYSEARRALDQCAPHLRSVEHAYLMTRLRREMTILRGHQGPVRAVACHEDHVLASGGDDATIRIWDFASGEQIHVLRGHERAVRSLCFSNDGKQLASSSTDGTVRVWDVPGGKQQLVIPVHDGPVNAVAFSSDGKQLASGDNGGHVRVWAADDGKPLFELPSQAGVVRSLSFSPNGRSLAVATAQRPLIALANAREPSANRGRHEIKIWDLARRAELQTLPAHKDLGHPDLRSLCFSPSTQYARLASAGGLTVKLWNPFKQEPLLILRGHKHTVRDVAVSDDGRRLASVDYDGVVRLWDAYRGTELATFRGHQGAVYSVAFGKQGLVTGGHDGTVRRWRQEQPYEKLTTQTVGDVTAVDATPSGLAAIAYTGISVLLQNGLPQPSPSPNATLTVRSQIAFDTGIEGPCWSVAISPDETRVACGGDSGVKVLDCAHGQLLFSLPDSGQATSLAWSDDGGQIIIGQRDHRVQTFEGKTGQHLQTYQGHERAVHGVALCAATRTAASASTDGAVRTWRQGKLLRILRGADDAEFLSVAMSREGVWTAAGGSDGKARVWHTQSGQQTHQFAGHLRPVRAVCLSTDGKRLASLCEDGFVKFWDLASGREIFARKGRRAQLLATLRNPPLGANGGWGVGFGTEEGVFYTIIQNQITWFPARPSTPR